MPRKKKPYTYFRRDDIGVTYVYANEDVWSDEAQKYVRKRHMIGKLDPETNEIIPTAGRGGYHGRKNKKEEEPQTAAVEPVTEPVPAPAPKEHSDADYEKLNELYEEERAAFTEYKQATNAKIREMKLKIDQLTVTLEESRRRYSEVWDAADAFTSKMAELKSDSDSALQ